MPQCGMSECEWEAGRQLVKQTQNEKAVSCDCGCNGLRIHRTVSNRISGGMYAAHSDRHPCPCSRRLSGGIFLRRFCLCVLTNPCTRV